MTTGEVIALIKAFGGSGGGSSGGGVLVVGVNGDTGALDKTAGELLAAFTNGFVVFNEEIDGNIYGAIMVYAHYKPNETKQYSFGFYMGSYVTYSAENSTDYPMMDGGVLS